MDADQNEADRKRDFERDEKFRKQLKLEDLRVLNKDAVKARREVIEKQDALKMEQIVKEKEEMIVAAREQRKVNQMAEKSPLDKGVELVKEVLHEGKERFFMKKVGQVVETITKASVDVVAGVKESVMETVDEIKKSFDEKDGDK